MNPVGIERLPLLAPHNGTSTSRAAAVAVQPKTATLREQVYAAIVVCGAHGATDEELQVALGMSGDTERPRRVELVKAHRIRPAGFTRPTTHSKEAVVYVAA